MSETLKRAAAAAKGTRSNSVQVERPFCKKMIIIKNGRIVSHGPGKDGMFCAGSGAKV